MKKVISNINDKISQIDKKIDDFLIKKQKNF